MLALMALNSIMFLFAKKLANKGESPLTVPMAVHTYVQLNYVTVAYYKILEWNALMRRLKRANVCKFFVINCLRDALKIFLYAYRLRDKHFRKIIIIIM